MKRQILIGSAIFSALVALGLATEDKYSRKVPDGLQFSELRGYEGWQTVAVSRTEAQNVIRVILANPVMIKAYGEGILENGKPFPDGAKLAKIVWKPKAITSPPFSMEKSDEVSGALSAVELMEKDTKRFPGTRGWGYAEFVYDAASSNFKPLGTGASCGAPCHNFAAHKDYVFTEYSRR
jgi:Cytochrome P460